MNDALASLVEVVVGGSTLLTFLILLGFIITDIFHERGTSPLFQKTFHGKTKNQVQVSKQLVPEINIPNLSLEVEA